MVEEIKEEVNEEEVSNSVCEIKEKNNEVSKKRKFLKYFKFGYVSESVIVWGVFILVVLMYLLENYYFINYMWYNGMEMTISMQIKGFMIGKYYRFIAPLFRIIVLKLILEYFYQVLKAIKTNNYKNHKGE